MNQRVIVQMDAKDANLWAAWQRAKKGPAEMAQEMEKLKGATRETKKSTDDTFTSLMKYGAVRGMIDTATDALKRFIDIQKQFRMEQVLATQPFEQAELAFATTARLGGDRLKKAIENITREGLAQAVTPTVAVQTATQMVSSNFPVESIESGEIVGEMLRIFQNSPPPEAGGPSKVEMAQQFSRLLNANQMEFNQENVRRLGAVFLAGTSRDRSLADLGELAKKAAVLKNANLDLETQMAAFFAMDALPGADAATGLRNIFSRMQTASASETKRAMMKKVGLAPEDIFTSEGEDPFKALDAIKEALADETEETRALFLRTMFEERGQGEASILLNQLEEAKRLRDDMRNSMGLLEQQDRIRNELPGTLTQRSIAKEEMSLIEPEATRAERIKRNLRAQLKDSPVRRAMVGAMFDTLDVFLDQEPAAILTGMALGGDAFTGMTDADPQAAIEEADLSPERLKALREVRARRVQATYNQESGETIRDLLRQENEIRHGGPIDVRIIDDRSTRNGQSIPRRAPVDSLNGRR